MPDQLTGCVTQIIFYAEAAPVERPSEYLEHFHLSCVCEMAAALRHLRFAKTACFAAIPEVSQKL